MSWKLDESRPIYPQIIDRVKTDIAAGHYLPGHQLPSVRDLALEAGVNPNTMQRALAELERSGLVESRRTSGRFITEDEKMIAEMKNALAEERIRVFLLRMEELGISREELIRRISRISENTQQPKGDSGI
jgi:DNA-binding transcriptional regulator YhcF (GntR family)